ncbi:MAG: hypothetical protein JW959_11210 [Pirellulales bacterium]|nr:hypothetical protein [Pirellulales bacterium]
MNARRGFFGLCRFSVLLVALTAAICLARPVAAAETAELGSSLKLAPEDAAFYASMLRNREQFDAVVNSNAFAKIKAMPAVQMAMMIIKMQMSNPGGPMGQFMEKMNEPENRKIAEMVVDMVSDEMFIYGDRRAADLLQLYQDVQGARTSAVLGALMTGDFLGADRLSNRAMLSALAEDVDLIAVPNVVLGFRVEKKELAGEQMLKLETMADLFFNSREETKGSFKKTKIGDFEYLVLELDGNVIPWEKADLETLRNMEAAEGDVDKIVERIKQLKLAVAVGLREEFLLVSIGPSLENLEKLGAGPRLADREEFEPLAKFADGRLTSVAFVSEEMNRRLNNQKRQIDNALDTLKMFLPQAELSDEQKQRIREDAEEAAEELKAIVPDVGAITSFSFLSDAGMESYRYAWGDFSDLDGTQKLTLLQHVGGDPLLGIVLRTRINVDEYDLLVKLATTAYGYFEEFGLPTMEEEDQRKLNDFLEAALPLLKRMDEVNRNFLIPSMQDGQLALVIDGKLQSEKFCKDMPPAEGPLPMIEPALVIGLSDAEKFRAAMQDYWDIGNGLIDAMRQVEGIDVPENFRIPEPGQSENSAGKLYGFPLPEEWGVDKRIVPNLGISEKAAVFSFSREHTARLMEAAPLAVGGVLDETEQPMAVAAWFDWAGLVDLAKPWIVYVAKQSPGYENSDEGAREMIFGQIDTALEVLKVLRKISSKCFFEEGALVSRTLIEIRDVEE